MPRNNPGPTGIVGGKSGGGGGSSTYALASRTGADAPLSGAWSIVPMDHAISDPNSLLSGGSFVAPATGIYRIDASIYVTVTSPGMRYYCAISLNGATNQPGNATTVENSQSGAFGQCGATLPLAAGDVVSLAAIALYGASPVAASSTVSPTLSIYRVA